MPEYIKQPSNKKCKLCKNHVKFIDYKDTRTLRKYVTERGKIKPSRVTGACRKHQHEIAVAVKRARIMALLPFTVPAVSGRGDRRNR